MLYIHIHLYTYTHNTEIYTHSTLHLYMASHPRASDRILFNTASLTKLCEGGSFYFTGCRLPKQFLVLLSTDSTRFS